MPHYALTTRPVDDARRDIDWLAGHHITALNAPMIKINPLDVCLPPGAGFDAVVLTSRHAAQRLKGAGLVRLPCYCVGAETAREADAVGFTDIITGPGDGSGLAQVIAEHMKTDAIKDSSKGFGARLFWPSGTDTGFDMAPALAEHGLATERLAVYKAAEATRFPAPALAAIAAGHVKVVLVHSGRSGAHFTRMMETHGLGGHLSAMVLVAISRRAAGLCGGGWHSIRIADEPRGRAVLASAVEAMRPNQNEA